MKCPRCKEDLCVRHHNKWEKDFLACENFPVCSYAVTIKDLVEIVNELEDNSPSYNKLVNDIENAPGTWLPALLARIAEECMKKNIFVKRKGLISYIKNVIVKEQISKGRDD